MNVTQSITTFTRIVQEDSTFRRLGRPPGWSVLFHYIGRWYDRKGLQMPNRRLKFIESGRRLEFEMSEKYLGAFKGVFIDREYDCTVRLSQPPRNIIDLGGNIGFGSVFLSRLYPNAALCVVEPDPRNLPLLKRNLIANGVVAHVIEGAIGPESGTVNLLFGDNPTCSSLAGTNLHDLPNSVSVELKTLPQILVELGWNHVDLLKIDIEGAEIEMLSSHNDWLSRIGAILIEIHPNTTPEYIGSCLAPFGFALERFGVGREPVYLATKHKK